MHRIFTACVLLSACVVFAQSPAATWTIDDVILTEDAGAFAVSPDGERAVFLHVVPEPAKDKKSTRLAMVHLRDGTSRPLLRGDDDAAAPSFSPDGKHVAFLAARHGKSSGKGPDAGEDDAPKTQVHLLPMSGGESSAATEFPEGVSNYAWIGAAKLLVAAREHPTAAERRRKEGKDTTIAVEDAVEWREGAEALFVVDLDAKSVSRLRDATFPVASLVADGVGKWAVVVRHPSPRHEVDDTTPSEVMLVDLAAGTERPLFTDRKSRPGAFAFSQDGTRLFALGNRGTVDGESSAGILVAAVVDTAAGTWRDIVHDHPRGFADPRVIPIGDGFVARAADGMRPTWRRFEPKGATWTSTPMEGEGVARITEMWGRPGASTFVVRRSSASDPGGFAVVRLEGRTLKTERGLDVAKGPDAALPKAKTEVITFKGAGGDVVEALLYHPLRHREGEKHPLYVLTHGGPHAADRDEWNDSWSYAPHLHAQEGAYVLCVNYHGSSDYGLAFSESIRKRYLELELIDLSEGIVHVMKTQPIDPKKIAVGGWSNGAILSIAMTALRSTLAPGYDFEIAACVAGAGDVNWISDIGPCEFGVAFDTYYIGDVPWRNLDTYIRKSALFKAPDVVVPTLILFGTEDRAVPTHQGWEWYRALQYEGRTDVRFTLFPGEPHGLRRLSHQRRKLDEEMRWMATHVHRKKEVEAEIPEGSPLWAAMQAAQSPRSDGRLGVATTPVDGSAPIPMPEIVWTGRAWMGRFEVTRHQWAAFRKSVAVSEAAADHPIAGVDAASAAAYCEWLGRMTGRRFRLPTESEWNAAHAGVGGRENTLDAWIGAIPSPNEAARIRETIAGRVSGPSDVPPLILAVGSRDARACGAPGKKVAMFDLGGNVAEWVTSDDGKTVKSVGGCAWTFTGPDAENTGRAPAAYVGFRVCEVR